MVNKVLLPQEIEVFYIIPAIRKEVAKSLKSRGINQKEIALRLGITEAAISLYMNDKRATEIDFTDNFKEEVSKVSNQITSPYDFIEASKNLIIKAKEELIICGACKKFSSMVLPKNCSVCFNG